MYLYIYLAGFVCYSTMNWLWFLLPCTLQSVWTTVFVSNIWEVFSILAASGRMLASALKVEDNFSVGTVLEIHVPSGE